MAEILLSCTPRDPWTKADACRWWDEHHGGSSPTPGSEDVTQAIELGATIGYSTAQRKV